MRALAASCLNRKKRIRRRGWRKNACVQRCTRVSDEERPYAEDHFYDPLVMATLDEAKAELGTLNARMKSHNAKSRKVV